MRGARLPFVMRLCGIVLKKGPTQIYVDVLRNCDTTVNTDSAINVTVVFAFIPN